MKLTCTVDQRNDITLVELDVRNQTRTARRIRIENTLAGEILPPRHHGTPVEGWDEEGVTVIVDAGEYRALGYACQARPKDPPARLVGSEPTNEVDTSTRSAGTVMTALGDPRPPRDVVEPELRRDRTDAEQGTGDRTPVTRRGAESEASDRTDRSQRIDSGDHDADTAEANEESRRVGRDQPVVRDADAIDDDEPVPIPPAIAAWLQVQADQVAADESVDARLLSAVSRRAGEIAARAER